MNAPELPDRALARRLRALREQHWPEITVTQRQLTEAFGGDRRLSESLISSWESTKGSAQPSMSWIAAYATFFATRRSIEGDRPRLLPEAELTEEERATRDRLHEELLELRSPSGTETPRIPLAGPKDTIGGGPWYFRDERPVTIVCARLPKPMRDRMPYTNPSDPDYVRAYTYTDVDALIELFGHIRATNPSIEARFKLADTLEEDDYSNHLVLLGGVDWNPVTKDIIRRLRLPVRQVPRPDEDPYGGHFEVEGRDRKPFAPLLSQDTTPPTLLEDVALFYRGPNPYNSRRTITLCNGMFGRGTYGAVRALTHTKFRDRNAGYLRDRFGTTECFGILHRVVIGVTGNVLTPDWTSQENRLFEWPE